MRKVIGWVGIVDLGIFLAAGGWAILFGDVTAGILSVAALVGVVAAARLYERMERDARQSTAAKPVVLWDSRDVRGQTEGASVDRERAALRTLGYEEIHVADIARRPIR
jgi:hypothetical protein